MNIIGAHRQSISDGSEVTCSPCYHLTFDTEVVEVVTLVLMASKESKTF